MKEKKQPLFVAVSNQKGGVGKSAFTVLLAGYFHYVKDRNVLVVDADYPQHSIHALRERDIQTVEKSHSYKQMIVAQFSRLGKKAYPVITAMPGEAGDAADSYLEKSGEEFDVVFFDLPGTVNTQGIFKSILNMDYVFTPIVVDRMAMQSSLSFVSAIRDFLSANPKAPLKGLYMFWNRVDHRVPQGPVSIYNKIMAQLGLHVMKTMIPETNRYSKELSISGKTFFRCTLLPPAAGLMKGSALDALSEEISEIIKL